MSERPNKPIWQPQTLLGSPALSPLHALIAALPSDRFPALEDCNALLAARGSVIRVKSGAELRFVAQAYGRLAFEAQYEPRCYLNGEVQTRADNWHDLFNALVWLTFPQAKAAVNARHYQALTHRTVSTVTTSQRGAVRDTNTLLDESGVVIAYADDQLAELLRGFEWKSLFWSQREQVRQRMGFFVFGHGLFEKAMQPYVGMTGQGLLLRVPPAFFEWPMPARLIHLDGLLAHYLAEPTHCLNTSELSPVPLLGIPGWYVDNERLDFYDDTSYFRAGRRDKKRAERS